MEDFMVVVMRANDQISSLFTLLGYLRSCLISRSVDRCAVISSTEE
jgi:hypothetical protein